jgi:hypothetical protein
MFLRKSLAPLKGKLLALSPNIRLGRKSLSRTNTSLLGPFISHEEKKVIGMAREGYLLEKKFVQIFFPFSN